MWVSGGLLLGFIACKTTGVVTDWIPVFQPGVFWLCGLVYAVSCLTLSCKYYNSATSPNSWGGRYLIMQLVAIASGFAAIYIGSVYQIGVLQEIGGTFLALYLLEKFFELPWNKDVWAWAALSLALVLYGAATFAEAHPQYFLGF
jgi:hypothetical protein